MAKWIATSVSGIASAARAGARLVEARITAMNPAVATISMSRAPMSVMPAAVFGAVMPAVTAAWLTATITNRPAAIAPTTWATM